MRLGPRKVHTKTVASVHEGNLSVVWSIYNGSNKRTSILFGYPNFLIATHSMATRHARGTKMFVLIVVRDTVVIAAARVHPDKLEEAIRWKLESKYANRVITGSGLVIKLHDILYIGYACVLCFSLLPEMAKCTLERETLL